jgi:hypothetical protein
VVVVGRTSAITRSLVAINASIRSLADSDRTTETIGFSRVLLAAVGKTLSGRSGRRV